MSSVAVAAVFTLCCFLCFRLTASKPKFTKEPPITVSASLGSSAIFSWDFSFGTSLKFERIIWGETDTNRNQIRNKYITIFKDRREAFNSDLDDSLTSRLSWAGNISKHGCQVEFILKNVTKLDETATYGCVAYVDGLVYRSGPIKLAVLIPPTITDRSNKTIDVEEGVNVTLHCDAIGDPTPGVLWVKDDKTLQNGTSTSTLQIPRIELRDAGTYVCTAANQAGSAWYIIQVRVVRYKPYINKTATTDPLIKSWINHTTTLTCAVDANPSANFTWLKHGQPVLAGVRFMHGMSTLMLIPKTMGDFGLYSCKAENEKGSMVYNITVERLYKPYINKTATTDPLIKSWINHTTTLTCAVDANPSANFTWLKHGQPLLAGVNLMRGMSTLTLIPKTMGDFGLYSCKAENEKGSMVYNITVERLYSPGPPVINKFTSDVQSVNVSWDAPQDDTDGGIFDYKITILEENYRMIQQYHGIKQTFFNSQNLKQNRSYIVFLQARNIVGYGESANGTVRTLKAEESTTTESSAAVTLRHTTYFPSEGSSTKRKSKKDTFTYLLLLWIILPAFTVPIIFFLSWKASKKITRCRGLKVTDFDGDCEQGNAFSLSKMEKLKERRISKHDETLMEDSEEHHNHGHCMEDESVIDNGNPVTDHQQIPGSIVTCDQTYEKPDSPGSKQDSIDLTKDDAKPFESFQMALK
nr:hemicentin-2-like [Pocillopora verrucosa]XP_058971307.1 hemicentin-2-like [Pocillopora verrucosa]XP_058971308.1 hemicentin-2-like [Pocillopora verrucosa]XP_058971309.1 hemicentin-2-like [Pocillopora verrucosa]